MKIREAIVLAGGRGTRLQSEVPDLPKSLAPVAGKPFLKYVLDYFFRQGIERFIFALGHMSKPIESFLSTALPEDQYRISLEDEPLDTGGAIKRACNQADDEQLLVLNADTFFGIDLTAFSAFHIRNGAACTLSLKPMKNFTRYGSVEMNAHQSIVQFNEKKQMGSGLINGGVYALNRALFLKKPFPSRFSFEKDYLEKYHSTEKIMGMASDAYFIDIGIPEDYRRAQTELTEHVV